MKTLRLLVKSLTIGSLASTLAAHAAAPSATTLNASNITTGGATLSASVNPHSATTRVYFQWGLTTNFGNYTATQNIGSGSSALLVQTPLTGLAAFTSYYFRVVASNSSGIVTGTNATFTTANIPPQVGSSALSVLSSTSARFYTGMNSYGSPSVAFWQWGLTASYGNTTPTQVFSNAVFEAIEASGPVVGLAPSTPYHFRGVASNQWGITYGPDAVFTTEPPVIATTLEDSNVGPFSATLNGQAYSAPGVTSVWYFQYGLMLNGVNQPGVQTPTQPFGSTGVVQVAATITNLTDSRQYYYRLVVETNSVVVLGNDGQFITGSMPADIQILRATNLTETTAKMKGIVTPNSINGSITDFAYQYGLTTNYGQITLIQTGPPNGFSSTLLETTATGLVPGTVYHFRMRFRRINTGEDFYSADQACSTLHIPTVTIQPGTVTSNLVTLNCLVNPNGLPTGVHFEWGPTAAYGNSTSTQALAAGSAAVPVSRSIGGLAVGQYHFRVVITSQDGIAATADQIFAVTSPEGFVVSTCSDIELRQAIITNNVVRFDTDCVIHLTNTLQVFSDVTIDATGHSVVLSGGGSNRLFNVHAGRKLQLIGVTIANGRVAGTNANPGSFSGATFGFTGGSAEGGGVLVSNAAFTARSCVFQNCSVQGGKGADTTSPVHGGFAGLASGAAIYGTNSSITLFDCTFKYNSANAGFTGTTFRQTGGIFDPSVIGEAYGGAFAHVASTGRFSRCTLAENFATTQGGAIHAQSGWLNLTNCTATLNSLSPGTANNGRGGALAALGVPATIESCTVANNRISNAKSTSEGSGCFLSGASAQIKNSILQGNSINSTPMSNISGPITDLGHSLSSDATPAWTSGTSLSNTDARLLPLANNGGPTPTMALRVGSPALNFADPGNFPPTDQRGVPRPQGSGADAGAWEGAGGPVQLSIIRENATTNRITWLSDTGLTYRVEAAGVMSSWSTLATGVPGNGGPVQFRTTNSGFRYFRVATEP